MNASEKKTIRDKLIDKLKDFYNRHQSLLDQWYMVAGIILVGPYLYASNVASNIISRLKNPQANPTTFSEFKKGLDEITAFLAQFFSEAGELILETLHIRTSPENAVRIAKEKNEPITTSEPLKQPEVSRNDMSQEKTKQEELCSFKNKINSVKHSNLSLNKFFHQKSSNETSQSQLFQQELDQSNSTPKVRFGTMS